MSITGSQPGLGGRRQSWEGSDLCVNNTGLSPVSKDMLLCIFLQSNTKQHVSVVKHNTAHSETAHSTKLTI
ncbi:unnamed protein product [Staurois parvus]|uniref:Uncharacterized protein n=1 Tax=Staurois parvus TaxID=386267 RepID=A0ABN9F6V2_9NEOB|nr:unnamed protein product [Staurois parvus]